MSRLTLTAVIAGLLAGCGGVGGLSSGRSVYVSAMELTTSERAVDSDGRPGTDGIPIRLTFYSRRRSRVDAVRPDGGVEIVMFDGEPKQVGEVAPLHTWMITPDQLKLFQATFYGLPCYKLTLKWPGRIPDARTVTIVARYPRGDGRIVQSAPSIVLTR